MTDSELYHHMRRSVNQVDWLRKQYELLGNKMPEPEKPKKQVNHPGKGFAKLYKAHHNIDKIIDKNDYCREYIYYVYHNGKCRWDAEI